MKSYLSASILALGLAVAVSTAGAAPDGERSRAKAFKERRAAIGARAAKQLDLTADQKAQLKEQREKTKAALQAVRDDESLSREQKRAKAHEILAASRTEGRGVLTPEQQAKADKMRENAKEKFSKRRAAAGK